MPSVIRLLYSPRRISGALLALLLWSQSLAGAVQTGNISTSELFSRAENFAGRDDFAGAIPFLREIIARFEEDPDSRRELERPLYFLGLGLVQANDLTEAEKIFTRYREWFPEGENLAQVLNFHGDVFRVAGRFPEAVETFRELTRHSAFRNDNALRMEVLEKLALSLMMAEQWEEGIPAFRQFLDESRDLQKRSMAASILLQAYIRTNRIQDAQKLLPMLVVETPSRYDIAFNVSLLRGGDAVFNEGDPLMAAIFYSLVLTPNQIRDYFTARLERLQAEVARGEAFGLSPERLSDVRSEISNAEAQLEALKGVEDYSLDLRLRQARIYAQMGRVFEAYWAFLRLYEENPNHRQAENFLFNAFAQAVGAGMESEAVRLGDLYKQNPRFTQFSDSIDVQLVSLYLTLEQYVRFEELAVDFIRRRPGEVGSSQLAFLLGSTLVGQQRYDELISLFGHLSDTVNRSLIGDALDYWRGMAHLFRSEFNEAFTFFNAFIEGFEFSPYREDAIFRRGVTLFGKGQIEEAEAAFLAFIERWPASAVRAEAAAFLGDIAAADGRLELALAYYRSVPESTNNMAFIDHAFFQAARLLTRNRRFEESIDLLESYIAGWPEDALVSEALFLIGKALDEMGRSDETVDRYFQSILRLGNEPFSFGIDQILEVFPRQYEAVRGNPPVELLLEAYNQARSEGKRTLAFRLEGALAGMGVQVADFRILDRDDLMVAGPATLIYFGNLIREEDPELSRQAFQLVIERFKDSPSVPKARLALGELALAENRLEDAMDHFERIVRNFPSSPQVSRASLRIGDTLFAQGRLDEAQERYQNILRTREFRGETWAEAQFKVGLLHFEREQFLEAHGFFQRVYVAFESFTEWASQAYLMSARSLEALGRTEDARNTLVEFTESERFRGTAAHAEAMRRINRS